MLGSHRLRTYQGQEGGMLGASTRAPAAFLACRHRHPANEQLSDAGGRGVPTTQGSRIHCWVLIYK